MMAAAPEHSACGFHVGFLGVHMPGVIERCGLSPSLASTWIAVAGTANIAGSVAVGLELRRHDPAQLLVGIYALRALGVAALVAMALVRPRPQRAPIARGAAAFASGAD